MEENRKTLTWVSLAGVLVLAMMIVYPGVMDRISEYRKEEISLAGEQKLSAPQQGEAGAPQKLQTEEMPEILLSVEGENENTKVLLWQSEDGTGYFFLPGYARNRGLVLEKADGGSIQIGSRHVKEGDVLLDVAEEETYQITYLDRRGETVFSMPLVFLYSADLPVLSLTTKSGEMTAIEEEKGYEESGTVQLLDLNGGELYEGTAESIRGRGNSTWGLAKKPFQFKLSKKADLLGFGEAKTWNLIANGYDETRLRNRIAMELAREIGMSYVPESQMIDLYINHVYYGNYYLSEKVEVDRERVAIRDMEETLSAAYGVSELGKLKSIENPEGTRKWTGAVCEEEDLSGGYLLERELPARYAGELSGFVTSQGDYYVLQSPRYASKEQVDYIADLMQEFQDAVSTEDGIHPQTGKHYSDYIDMDSFVRKYLVEEISKNYDGGVTSSFFYKPQDTVSDKIFAGPVWDFDVAFGNCNLDEIASNPVGITRLSDHVYGTEVFARLYEKEDFYSDMVMLYEQKALPYLKSLLAGGIDRMVAESRQSAELDSIRWESLENRYQYYKDYDNDVRYLKYFIQERVNFLNSVWLNEESYHNVTFVVDGEAWQIFCVKDGLTSGDEPIPARYSSLFMGWVTEAGVPYDRYKPVYEDMTFYAIWQELPVEDVVLTEP